MESFKKFVNTILYPAGLIFTAIVFTFSLMYEIAGLNGSPVYNLTDHILFAVFSLIFSWTLQIFKIKNIKYVKALFLNFLCFLADAFFVFTILGGKKNTGGMLIIFTAVYVVFAIVFSIARKLESKSAPSKKNQYKKMFK